MAHELELSGSPYLSLATRHEAHNNYLRVFYEVGAAGLVACFLLYSSLVRLVIAAQRKPSASPERFLAEGLLAVLLVLAVTGLVDNFHRNTVTLWYLMALLGLVDQAAMGVESAT